MMTIPIRPLADRVVATKQQSAARTTSGLYIPEAAKEKPLTATIVAVGPDVATVKLGEHILYKEYSTTDVTIDSVEYLIVKEEDIIATVVAREEK